MAGRFAFGLENWTLPPEPKSGQGHCDCDEQGWSKANVHQLQVRLAVVLDVVVGASGAGQEAAEREMGQMTRACRQEPVEDWGSTRGHVHT